MTEDEWQKLYENFETRWLLDAIGEVDTLRGHLSDDEYQRPPEIRDNLFKLHQLAMEVVNDGSRSSLVEQFDAKPAEIRRLLRGDLDLGRTQELLDEMRAAGLPT